MSESDRTLSPGKKRVFWAILLLIALAPLLLAEAWVRVAYPPIDLWALTGRAPGSNPMAEWAVVDAFAAYRGRAGAYADGKTVNRHGFISTPDLTVEKPAGTLRVAFLGGSSTAGTGYDLPDEVTWPWQTVERLRARTGRDVQLINGAVGGYTTFESYGRLWSRIRFFDPDVIVVDHAWNEMYYFHRVDEITEWRTLEDGSWAIDRTTEPVAWHRPLPIDPLIRPSQLLTRLRFRYLPTPQPGEAAPASDGALDSTFDRAGLAVFRTHLRLLRETARLMDADLFVVKQPTLIVPDLPEAERDRVRYDYHGFDHHAHVAAFREIYRVIDSEIESARIIDATDMSGVPELFHDHVHPTPEGAARLAGIVADAVAPVLEDRR